jgi:hypothetical protein
MVSAFLSSHPTIEHLSFWSINGYRRASICSPDRIVLPPSALPRLRILDASAGDIFTILSSTDVNPRPLQRISGLSIHADFLECLDHSGSGPTLKRLDATDCADTDFIVKLASIAPGLEWLNAGDIDVWNLRAKNLRRSSVRPFPPRLFSAPRTHIISTKNGGATLSHTSALLLPWMVLGCSAPVGRPMKTHALFAPW